MRRDDDYHLGWRLLIALPLIVSLVWESKALMGGVQSAYVQLVVLLVLIALVVIFLPGRHPLLVCAVLFAAILMVIVWTASYQGALQYQAKHPSVSYGSHIRAVQVGGATYLYVIALCVGLLWRAPGIARERRPLDRYAANDPFRTAAWELGQPGDHGEDQSGLRSLARGDGDLPGWQDPDELAP